MEPEGRTLETASSPFAVTIVGAAPECLVRTFRVVGPSGDGSVRTREYRVRAQSHGDYLDLFRDLARDFGFRVPSARSALLPGSGSAGTRPILTCNVSPEILYGYGDPCVLRVDENNGTSAWYYVIVTSNDAPQSFPIVRSPNLRDWELAAFAFPVGHKPKWAATASGNADFWAPEIHRVGSGFVLCFAARQHDGELAIGFARAVHPVGPYIADDEPVLRGAVIDPHIFVEEDGTATLFWKHDSNDRWPLLLSQMLADRTELVDALFPDQRDAGTARFAALLSPWVKTLRPMERFFVQHSLIESAASNFSRFRSDLAKLAAVEGSDGRQRIAELLAATRTRISAQRFDAERLELVGEPVVVLENDLDWEGHVIEGVWVTKSNGVYHLFYSGNDFASARYGIGAASASALLGPYEKRPKPILRSNGEWWGPGHPSFARGPSGEPLLFFHAYRPGHVGYKEFRALLALDVKL